MELPLDLFDGRWKQRSSAAVLAAEQALLQRRPARGAPGLRSLPDRSERYGLVVAAARGVAEVGAATMEGYQTSIDGLAQLLTKLRLPGAPGAAAPARRPRKLVAAAATAAAAAVAAAVPAANGDADGLAGPLCNSCWQRGHYKSNRHCPNFGKPAIEKPRAFGRAKRFRGALFETSSDEAEAAAEDSNEEDGNDNVCHACSQPGLLSMCDTCLRSWHDDCVSLADRQRIAAAAAPGSAWSCSVCVGEPFAAGFVNNPQRGGAGRQPEPQALPLSAGGLAGDARKGEEGGPEGRGAAVPLARAAGTY